VAPAERVSPLGEYGLIKRELRRQIMDTKDLLEYARAEGDSLKIALYESSLNDLLDRYSSHTCQRSQTEKAGRQ
jgi:hypothetical protein